MFRRDFLKIIPATTFFGGLIGLPAKTAAVPAVSTVDDFASFCKKLKVLHPIRGLISYRLEDCHRKIIEAYETERYVIYKKYRQSGFMTLNIAYALWKAINCPEMKLGHFFRTEHEAVLARETLGRFTAEIPLRVSYFNCHELRLANGSKLLLGTPEIACSKTINICIYDDPAYWPNAEQHWKAMYPTLCTGGKAFIYSTPRGKDNWFADIYTRAESRTNMFKLVLTNYRENFTYKNCDLELMRKQLGDKGWRQEVLAEFI